MEAVFLAQHDQKLEVIEAAHGKSRLPCAAQVDDKAAVVLQNAMKLFRKGTKPVKIGILLFVAIILLAGQREGRAGQDQVDGCLLATLHHVQAVGVIDAPETGFMVDGRKCFSGHLVQPSSSASIFDHGIEMMQLDPFRQFGPFFFTQTDHIELLHNHPSQLWPAAYWEATYHACALR